MIGLDVRDTISESYQLRHEHNPDHCTPQKQQQAQKRKNISLVFSENGKTASEYMNVLVAESQYLTTANYGHKEKSMMMIKKILKS